MKLLKLFLITLSCVCRVDAAQDALSECPLNLQRNSNLWAYEDWCFQVYIFNHHGLHNHDWNHARDDCRRRGGELLQIRNADTQAFVATRLYQQHYDKTWRFWIGASDHRKEGHWEWVSDPIDMDYSNWSPGQGTDQHGFLSIPGGLTEDCAVLDTHDHARWHDYPCAAGAGFWYSHICQFVKRADFHGMHANKTSTTSSTAKTTTTSSTSRTTASTSPVTKDRVKSTSPPRQSSADSGTPYPATKSSVTTRAEPTAGSPSPPSTLSTKTFPTEEVEIVEGKTTRMTKSTFFTKLVKTTKSYASSTPSEVGVIIG